MSEDADCVRESPASHLFAGAAASDPSTNERGFPESDTARRAQLKSGRRRMHRHVVAYEPAPRWLEFFLLINPRSPRQRLDRECPMHAARRSDIAPRIRRPHTWAGFIGCFTGAIAVLFLSPRLGFAQEPDVVVSKDAISVHRVERGTMILRETASGSISSLAPARATVVLSPQQSAVVRVGQVCSGQIVAPLVMHGRVTQVRSDTLRRVTAELEFREAFAPGTALDDRVAALIEIGTADNVVYFERPASARPATRSTIFVLESDGQHAKRVAVVYGRLSGSQLEIISGLEPGERVIVTDLPALAGRDRVVLK